MTLLEVLVAVVVVLLTICLAAVLVLGGVLVWYIRAAEHQSTRKFTRIYDPAPEPSPLDTDPDSPAG